MVKAMVVLRDDGNEGKGEGAYFRYTRSMNALIYPESYMDCLLHAALTIDHVYQQCNLRPSRASNEH